MTAHRDRDKDSHSESPGELEPGDLVRDRDDTQRDNQAVVVNTPPVSASDWVVHHRHYPDRTVAKDNPAYPADSAVVIVVFTDGEESHLEYYSGGGSIKLAYLNDKQIPFYAFPRPRLRKCGSRGGFEIPVEKIRPSPYHSRSFTVANNEQFIDEIAERGYPEPFPLVRITDSGEFVLVNGHRRVWASCVSGLSSIRMKGCYLTAKQAARIWCRCHLGGYTQQERASAITALESRFGDAYRELLE